MRRTKRGISGFVATLILISITLTLSYVVYEGVSRFAPPEQLVFSNQIVDVGGDQGIVQLEVNASSSAAPLAFDAGDASSQSGVLYFDGTRYGTSSSLCLADATTFFSVYTTPGVLEVSSTGPAWIDGFLTDTLRVDAGWQEVMVSDSTSCTVALPQGTDLGYPSPDLSTIPLIGNMPSTAFDLYVPAGPSAGPFVLVFDGSYDRIA